MAMTTAFRYRAAARDGSIVRGSLTAPDRDTAKRRLSAEGLAVVRLESHEPFGGLGRVRRRDLAAVFRNVSILVSDGVPVERALAASELLIAGQLRRSIEQVRRRLKDGHSVAEAMDMDDRVFPRSLVGIMRAGERGSRLADACETIADQLDADVKLRAELWSALTYPTLVLFVGIASLVVMGAVVIPRFADVFAGLGAELPPATRALLAASDAIRRYGIGAAFAVGLGCVFAARLLRRPEVRVHVDRVLLETPLVGGLRMGFASARACRALGGMLTTGMPLLSALDVTIGSTGDAEVSRRLERARDAVARGARLTDALSEERVLTPFVLQLVAVGESSGRLGSMVSRAGDLVADRTQAALRATVSLVEPLLIVILGGFVAGVAGALLQAVYSVRP